MTSIRKVTISNPDRETDCHDCGVPWTFSFHPGKFRDNTTHYVTTPLSQIIYNSVVTVHPTFHSTQLPTLSLSIRQIY
jgi:hypothetical protein